MKAQQFATLALIAIIGIALIGCKEDEPDPVLCTCPNGTVHTDKPCDCGGEGCTCTYKQPITREFIIQIDGKSFSVTVEDTRNGSDDTDLDELGIIDAIANELNESKGHPKFDEVFGRVGFVIVVEDTDDYDYYKAYNPTKLGFNFEFLKNPGALLPTAIGMSINAMVDGADYPSEV